MRKRPSRNQIAAFLRDFQADLDVAMNINQACRKAGVGLTTYQRWKALQKNPVSNERLHVAITCAENGMVHLVERKPRALVICKSFGF